MAEQQLAVWWTDQKQAEAVSPEQYDALPDYIKSEFKSRCGRAGRGRLWSADEFGNFGIDPWPDNDLGKELGKDSGGIVFKMEDIEKIKGYPGVITDEKLNLLHRTDMVKPAVVSKPLRISGICPKCDHVFFFPEEHKSFKSVSCTCDCNGCGALLLVQDGVVYPFHEKLNADVPRWPKDGKGTGAVTI